MIAYYTLTIRRRFKTELAGKTVPCDEADLIYLAHQTFREKGEFRQFFPGELTEPREWWHQMMNWLTWLGTEEPPEGRKPPKEVTKKLAARLSWRIEAMLDGPPTRIVESPRPEQEQVEERAVVQKSLFDTADA